MPEPFVFDASAASTFVENEAHVRNDEEETGLDGDWKYVTSMFVQLGFFPFVTNPGISLNRYLKSTWRFTLATGEYWETVETVDRWGAGLDTFSQTFSPNQAAFELAQENSQLSGFYGPIRTVISETEVQTIHRNMEAPFDISGTIVETLSELNTIESCAEDCMKNLDKVSLDELDWGFFSEVTNPYGFFNAAGDPLGGSGGQILRYSRFGINVDNQTQYFFNTDAERWYYVATKVQLTAQAPICIVTYKQSFLGTESGWGEGELTSCLPFSADGTTEGVLEVITIPPPVESGKDRYYVHPYVKINGGEPDCCRS